MSVRDLLDSAPIPSAVRLVVDGVPRALWLLDAPEARGRVFEALTSAVAGLPSSSSVRVELADNEQGPSRAFVSLSQAISPAAPPTPADQMRGVLGAVEGLGRLGLQAIDKAQSSNHRLLTHYERENERLRERIGNLEARLTVAWEQGQGSAAELVEARERAETRRELLSLAGSFARALGGKILGGQGNKSAAVSLKLDALRRSFADAAPEQLAGLMAQLTDSQKLAVMELLSQEEEAEAPADPEPYDLHPLALIASANRGQA
jgi:hypothetical protein